MTDPPKYILCKWRKRFWPAKILGRTGVSRRTLSNWDPEILNVEILVVEKQISVKYADTKPLDKSQVENIATKLEYKGKKSDSAVEEELTYRNALRVALNILNQNTLAPARRTKPCTGKMSQCSNPSNLHDRELQKCVAKEKRQKRSSRLATCQTENQAASPILVKRNAKTNRKLTKSLESSAPCLPGACISKHMHGKVSPCKVSAQKGGQTVQSVMEKTPSASVKRDRKFGGKRHREYCNTEFSPERSLEYTAQNMTEEIMPVSELCYSVTSTPVRKISSSVRKPTEKLFDFLPRGASELACDSRSVKSMRTQSCTEDVSKATESVNWLQDRKPERYQECLKPSACDYPENTSISSLELQCESDIEGRSPKRSKASKLPDFEEKGEFLSSDLSMEFSLSEAPSCSSTWVDEDKEEDEELPSILLQQEPLSVEPGMLVWCKFQKYPYWPAVVRNVKRKRKKATIVFIEESLSDPTNKNKSLSVGLRTLKHFDCEEKRTLTDKAKEDYGKAIDWCIALIQDYRIRIGCGSFVGSFEDYCTADISYPVRREVNQGSLMVFPVIERETEEESQSETSPAKQQSSKKMLPDRTRAARDKANEKLVNYIMKNKKVEKHLLAIMKGKKKSRWFQDFLNTSQSLNCIETYLEDEEQCEMVVTYLKSVCDQMSSSLETLKNGDRTRFTLDVLLPEAVICAISAVDKISYERAEEKYMRGPSVSKREREIFEKKILEEKKLCEILKMEAVPGGIKDEH
ncbi:PWWP domain-containing DNA repair factor 3A isoform X2 [Microcaecilia unicolor]|uniref:PWWP domain-containing DNA repair factor 3A isoform X2 n=1 Tax=Microcaecilia unicolor TaxID=1415580 RepID=A0A6P7ZL36_9AMPH|nr:PWWP domain-containing DNA repair factor 3A isoform X2 [Microcaecilia unicolor]